MFPGQNEMIKKTLVLNIFWLAAALALMSKNWIRLNGRHVFNPNNFGICAVLFAFPDMVAPGVIRWGGETVWSLALVGAGIVLVILANRWAVSLSYAVGFLVMNTLSAWGRGVPLWTYSTTLLAPALQLSIFFMMTDPKTSPESRRQQLAFGVFIALLDHAFRLGQTNKRFYYATFLATLVYTLLRNSQGLRGDRREELRRLGPRGVP